MVGETGVLELRLIWTADPALLWGTELPFGDWDCQDVPNGKEYWSSLPRDV